MSDVRAYDTIVSAVVVVPSGETLFCEGATTVELTDEGAGMFVTVSQDGEKGISITDDEWPVIRESIERMITTCVERNAASAAGRR